MISRISWPIVAFVQWTRGSQRRSLVGHFVQGVLMTLALGSLYGLGATMIWFVSRELANAEDRGGWTRDETEDLIAGVVGSLLVISFHLSR